MSPSRRPPRNIREVDPNSFGAQLRRLRVDAGLSQEELAEAIGTDQTRISAYEVGKFRPQEDIIIALAAALNVAPAHLLESSQWGGALPIGTERRQRLMRLQEREWQAFDRLLDVAEDMTPEQRMQFEAGFAKFLEAWRDPQKT